MKKILTFFFCMMLLAVNCEGARLFEYRGVFPAARDTYAKISNYVLLKKGSLVKFTIQERNERVKGGVIVAKIKLTSDEKVSFENLRGITEFKAPESGIYEITTVPATNIPEELSFLLSIFETQEDEAAASEHLGGYIKPDYSEEKTEQVLNIATQTEEVAAPETVEEEELTEDSVAADDDLLFGNPETDVLSGTPEDIFKSGVVLEPVITSKALVELPENAVFVYKNSFSVLESPSDRYLAWPQDVQWGGEGNLWVLDSQKRRLQYFTEKGEMQKAFGEKGTKDGQLGLPVAIAILGDMIFVSDYSNHALHLFNSSGLWQNSIKSDKSAGLFLDFPGSVCFRHEEMWVPDRGNSGILCFDLKGTFLGTFVSTHEAPIESPISVRADEDSLFVMQKNGIMKVFNPMGTLESSVNTACKEVSGFEYDFWGSFWICDGVNSVVKRFDQKGRVLLEISSPSGLPEPWIPTSLALRNDGKLAVADAANKMVHIFAVE